MDLQEDAEPLLSKIDVVLNFTLEVKKQQLILLVSYVDHHCYYMAIQAVYCNYGISTYCGHKISNFVLSNSQKKKKKKKNIKWNMWNRVYREKYTGQ